MKVSVIVNAEKRRRRRRRSRKIKKRRKKGGTYKMKNRKVRGSSPDEAVIMRLGTSVSSHVRHRREGDNWR
jgi:hypothetical protein